MEVLNNKEVDFGKLKNGIFTFTVNIPLKAKDKLLLRWSNVIPEHA